MPSFPPPPGIILAGGKSSRMGTNKAEVLLGGLPMIAHVIRHLAPQVSHLSVNAPAPLAAAPDLPAVPDVIPGQGGPLVGILTAMRYAASAHPGTTHVVTASVDSPFLPLDLVERLASALPDRDTIAIADSAGEMHPICGLWPVHLADDLERWLALGEKARVKAFLARHPVRLVDFPLVETTAGMLDPFLNINSPDELERAHRFLEDA
ncbi:molybdenum cofactor guanylyltransferase MobA [Rhizobium oryzicola]|uniref:Molybdenum cofactor guanylyltransferase n=1 Tax=Rhizobium oryzicola TaxID=1232668 RepID=A0ABT8T3V1_9HYPH|nr:molybdenum cofactor guanylyltransferase MobA [Rhizobium oryzicola]MDO1584587.1 molybdenum cofactor guanylyltransferase MobA [Rhizobium oryzicola]